MTSLRTLLQSAFESARKGRYPEAFEEFQLILSHDPRHPEALYGSAACAYRLDRLAEAKALVERFLEIEPKNLKALQLQEEILAKGAPTSSFPSIPEPEMESLPVEERFGVVAGRKARAIPDKWIVPEVRLPGMWDHIRAGRLDQHGTLRPLAAFSQARKTFRLHRKALFRTNLWCSLVFLLVAGLAGGLVYAVSWSSLRSASITAVLLFPLVSPLLGLFSFYGYRIQRHGEVALGDYQRFLEVYPYLIFATAGSLAPGLAGLSGLLVFHAFLVQGEDPAALALTIQRAGFYLIALVQVSFLIRCWFLNLVPYDLTKEPWTLLAESFWLTQSNPSRLTGFLLLEGLVLILGVLSVGYLLPLLPLMQAEGYGQLAQTPTGGKGQSGSCAGDGAINR